MKRMQRFLTVVLLAVLLSACLGSGPAELLDTAQLEEQQYNHTHALELYQEIVAKHPGSEQAEVARERIQALQKMTNQ